MKKIYVIVGANSQISRALVSMVKHSKNQLLLTDLVDAPAHNYITGDICDPTFVSYLFDKILSYGTDVRLVNLAGVTHPKKGVYPIDFWKHTIDVNGTGAFNLLREFHVRVVNHEIFSGSIVNISSSVANKVIQDNPAYTASKLMVESLTRHYASILAPYKVSVNCIAPGYVKSGMTQKTYNNVRLRKKRSRLSYLNRWGEPEEIAELIWYLFQKTNSFLTGSTLYIDGGWSTKSGL